MILGIFYAIYLGKMLSQKKKGIRTDQMGRGKSDRKRARVEITLKIESYLIVVVQMISIFYGHSALRYTGKTAGIVLGVLGDLCFLTAVITMADSWRAGIAEKDETSLVQSGIYRFSRNPAFLGFELVYTGILLMFYNRVLLFFTVLTFFLFHLQILQEERYLADVFKEDYLSYRKKVCRYFGRKDFRFLIPFWGAVVLAIFLYIAYGRAQAAKLPELSFQEMLQYTTKGNSDVILTVGIIRDGKAEYTVYGKDAKILPKELHTYEIGSLTKTITAACIAKAEEEGKLSVEDTIDRYLTLPAGGDYPTIKELLTHTSGYKAYYLETPMILNWLIDRNSFYGITDEMLLSDIERKTEKRGENAFVYSNFGFALLGRVLESVDGEEYGELINAFVKNDLGLENTAFAEEKGDLNNYWEWKLTDAYASAGALTSDIEDMLRYAQIQLENSDFIAKTHESLAVINASPESYRALGIFMDEIGMAWILDRGHDLIWHNGGTDNYNCYLGFSPKNGTAVVILSNFPGGYRISATVMGARLLQELYFE